MLYFSKIKIISIIIITVIFAYLTTSNFFKFDDNLIKKKINLGLDLQGGSYLLLEVDSTPIVLQKIQTKFTSLKKFLREKGIKFRNIKIENQSIVLHSGGALA